MKQKTLDEASIEELKAAAYDTIKKIETLQQVLKLINTEITKKEQNLNKKEEKEFVPQGMQEESKKIIGSGDLQIPLPAKEA